MHAVKVYSSKYYADPVHTYPSFQNEVSLNAKISVQTNVNMGDLFQTIIASTESSQIPGAKTLRAL